MLHLDANALVELPIYLANPESILNHAISKNEPLACSALAWYEFMAGPLDERSLMLAKAVLSGGILPITPPLAVAAAQLFNQTGRKRSLKTDCLIAAHAIQSGAPLFTRNTEDFRRFEAFGLVLRC
ncbi:MAG: hypothetical protein RLZZ502_1615 [Pseudomonadota bacterium]|jgi:predicted nucleic acid-binding protein